MTDEVLEAVTRAICRSRYGDTCIALKQPDGTTRCGCTRWAMHTRDASVAITSYLEALKEEGKQIISERDIQNLISNRKIYEG